MAPLHWLLCTVFAKPEGCLNPMYPSASVEGVYFLGTVALRAGLSQRVMYMVSAVKICEGRSCAINPHDCCL